jgi:hypothetical protein
MAATTTRWTYETLAKADMATLERVMLEGTAPDMQQLVGWIYCGWNHEWVGRLSGEKFKKGFWPKDGQVYGFNEMCYQDSLGVNGKWRVRMLNRRPIQLGYFRCSLVKDEPPEPLNRPYRHLGHFNYNVSMNTWQNLPFRVIRDFVVLPNEGDHELMLCKAFLQGTPQINVFYCYFLLGRREKIQYEPW